MKVCYIKLFLSTILIGLSLSQPCLAQGKFHRFTYFGVEIGAKNEIFQLNDNGNELYQKRNFQHGLSGLFIEQELNRWFNLGTGIYFTQYSSDFRFRRDDGFYSLPTMRTIMTPLRLQMTIPIYYGIPEIRIKPGIGVMTVFNKSQSRDSLFGKIAPVLSDQYTGTIRYDFQKYYFLAEAGLQLELLFAKGIVAALSAQYHRGFNTIAETKIQYRIDKKTFNGVLSSSGDFFNISLSVKYPISRWWNSRSVSR